jgi:hypothetical protein
LWTRPAARDAECHQRTGGALQPIDLGRNNNERQHQTSAERQ